MRKIALALILIAIIAGIGIWKAKTDPGIYLEQQRRVLMTTYVTIYAYGKKPVVSYAINSAFQKMTETSAKFNAHDQSSQIYKFNQNGNAIKDKEILKVARIALDVARETGGAYDITVYPLVKLWGFYEENPGRLPLPEEILDAMKNVGYQHLLLTDTELKTDKENIFIDLGSIAKGYVISQGIEALKKSGVNSAIIQAGGDTYVLGYKNKKLWRIGIRHPRKNEILGYLEVNDQAIMSSGDYERFFMKDKKRYHHIIDPRTGYPAKGLSAVTVIYSDPVVADAWATALSVIGPKGFELIERIPGMEAVMVTDSGEILCSPGLKLLTPFPDCRRNSFGLGWSKELTLV